MEVHTDSGLVGLGETYAGVYAPELIAPVTKFISQRLVGLDPRDPEKVAEKAKFPFIGRNGLFCSVYSAIDIALWDIAGQAADKPIHELLYPEGRPSMPSYASGGSAAMSREEVAKDASLALEAGFGAFKMRVGVQDWKTDIARVEAARKILGNSHLMVDAIMGTINPPWTLETAMERLKNLAEYSPYWLEEPLYPDDVILQGKLRNLTKVKIASGEALTGWLDYSAYLKLGAVDIIQVDPTHCGGITLGKKIIDQAHALGIPTAMHVWGSAAAYLANSQLAFSHPSVEWMEVPMVSLELTAKMLPTLEQTIYTGLTPKPNGPGLGVSLTAELKECYEMVVGSGYRL